MLKGCSDDFITLKYLKRYPNSKNAKTWGDTRVIIETDRGYWRENAQGYTGDKDQAWVVTFKDAIGWTWALGPEKRTIYHKVN